MFHKKLILLLMVAVLVASSLAMPTSARAGAAVCGGSVTVASGDTLRKIANRCGTTVNALKLANNLKDANVISVGQVLVMPGALIKGSGGVDIYIVNHRDTLRQIARTFNTTLENLLKLNPAITNANLIYAGQRLNVPAPGSTTPTPPPTTPPPTPTPPPASGQTYTVVRGDTMRKIAARLGITLDALTKANPQIANINRIFVGQKLNIPDGISVYVVVRGDTLRRIASRFGTSVDALLKLNPDIKNANIIHVGQVIKLR